MSTCTRIRIRASFLSCLDSSQAKVDRSPIKVLADHPVGQASKFILVIIQIVTMVKQKLCKLWQNLPEGVLVLQLHKCPRATTILDWPTSFPCYAEGITLRRVKRENLLQANLMLPPVGQVIFVDPRFLPAEVEVPQLDLMGIVVEAHPSGSRDPVRFPPNEELVQMLIRPAKRNLQRVMKLGNRAVAAHEQATPNLGTDVAYPDAQLIHLHRVHCAAHTL